MKLVSNLIQFATKVLLFRCGICRFFELLRWVLVNHAYFDNRAPESEAAIEEKTAVSWLETCTS